MKRSYDKYDVKTRHEYQRNYYYKRMSEARQQLGNKCAFCGWDEVIDVLEFAHRVGEKKDFCIGNVLRKSKTLLQKELDKCILLCPNCHRIYDLRNGKRGAEVKY